MFNVICINNGPMANTKGNVISAPELKEGVIYTVIEVTKNYIVKRAFILEEVSLDKGWCGYNPKRFIPLSEIDETEMVREYNVVTIK